MGSHRRRVGDGSAVAGVRPADGPIWRAVYATGITMFGPAVFPVFAMFSARNVAWYAAGMILAFGYLATTAVVSVGAALLLDAD